MPRWVRAALTVASCSPAPRRRRRRPRRAAGPHPLRGDGDAAGRAPVIEPLAIVACRPSAGRACRRAGVAGRPSARRAGCPRTRVAGRELQARIRVARDGRRADRHLQASQARLGLGQPAERKPPMYYAIATKKANEKP
jgi:hypothetical protein